MCNCYLGDAGFYTTLLGLYVWNANPNSGIWMTKAGIML